jgi:hypothetical protein
MSSDMERANTDMLSHLQQQGKRCNVLMQQMSLLDFVTAILVDYGRMGRDKVDIFVCRTINKYR